MPTAYLWLKREYSSCIKGIDVSISKGRWFVERDRGTDLSGSVDDFAIIRGTLMYDILVIGRFDGRVIRLVELVVHDEGSEGRFAYHGGNGSSGQGNNQ
jgi:hypothetical protein